MIDLQYEQLLSPLPVKLSIGVKSKNVSLRKPTLLEIDEEITLAQFDMYEAFLKMTPEIYFTHLLGEDGTEHWKNLSYEEKSEITVYSLISSDKRLQITYENIFNFFFKEKVVYESGFFVMIDSNVDSCVKLDDIKPEQIFGLIKEDNFLIVLDIIQQTCCIRSKANEPPPKFKNAKAKSIYEKILKDQEKKEKKKAKINDKKFTLGNIISSTSNRHSTISPITVWNLTIFQLLDSFNRLQVDAMYTIDSMRVSTWGDEKKTFDATLWYKNIFDKS